MSTLNYHQFSLYVYSLSESGTIYMQICSHNPLVCVDALGAEMELGISISRQAGRRQERGKQAARFREEIVSPHK